MMHLLGMPVTATQIAMAKTIANSMVVFVAFVLSLFIAVQGALEVPIAGSEGVPFSCLVWSCFAGQLHGVETDEERPFLAAPHPALLLFQIG